MRDIHLVGPTMTGKEKSAQASNGGLYCSHILQWIYVLALTGLTVYQFLSLQQVKEELAILKEVCILSCYEKGLSDCQRAGVSRRESTL